MKSLTMQSNPVPSTQEEVYTKTSFCQAEAHSSATSIKDLIKSFSQELIIGCQSIKPLLELNLNQLRRMCTRIASSDTQFGLEGLFLDHHLSLTKFVIAEKITWREALQSADITLCLQQGSELTNNTLK